MSEQDREIRGTIVPQGDAPDGGTNELAAARLEIEATRERMSGAVAEIEAHVASKAARVKEKLDVVGLVKANPWPSLAAAIVAGIALGATGADRKAASATARAAKRAPDTAKSGVRAAATGVAHLASAAVDKVRRSPADGAGDGTHEHTSGYETTGLVDRLKATATGQIDALGDELRKGVEELPGTAVRRPV